MMRAVCAAVVHGGFDFLVRRLFPLSPPAEFKDKLFSDLQERAEEYYRGEVWPLRYAFGVLSRFINGTTDENGKVLTPAVVTTWLGEGGFISCSCVGQSGHIAHLRASSRGRASAAAATPASDEACGAADGRAAVGVAADGGAPIGAALAGPTGVAVADANCAHARTFATTIQRLCRRLGVPVSDFRAAVPGVFGNSDAADGDASAGAVGGSGAGDWDAEGPLEIFQTGQSVVAVVVSGLGPCKVVAPVRCTRHVTSCSFCDNAAGFSCVHAVRCRGVSRGGGTGARGANAVSLEDDCVDGARSRLALPMYNCKKAVCANLDVCEMMREGKPLVVQAPPMCDKCGTPRGCDTRVDVEEGVIMCSGGYCVMQLQSFMCTNAECHMRVFPDGRDAGVVLLSSSTAATVTIMRDIAHAMTTGGSTFGSCYKQWHSNYASVRDSGRYPCMATVPTRSRQTMTTLFWWTLHLMTKSPPLWAFKCGSCQDKDGRFRVLTADGIWLGYLKRLASGRYVNPCEECKSVQKTVEAASLHPSEWVRRFVRSVLKQPVKAVVIKAGQLGSAQRALAFLCPAALPNVREPDVTPAGTLALTRLRALLCAVWNLEQATRTLCDAIITHVKKLIAPTNALPASTVDAHRRTLQDLAAWKARVAGLPVALAQPVAAINLGDQGAPAGGDVGLGGGVEDGGGDEPVDGAAGVGQGADSDAPDGAGALGGGVGRARGAAGRARQPAATACAHHYDRTTAEPGDPRCLRSTVKELGTSLYKDVCSFCVAVAIDPVVNGFKPRHVASLTQMSDVLRGADAAARLDTLIAYCAGRAEAISAVNEEDVAAAALLAENRMLLSFLSAVSSDADLFASIRFVVADLLLSIRATIENYHTPRDGTDGSSMRYYSRWGDPRLTPAELRARFVAEYPNTPEEPQVTGAFFPGLSRCRPNAFATVEEADLGTCAKHYKDVHKHYSPGTFTICCACTHPKMIGFVVLDKREGPPALLNTILSYFALLPSFLVYDFGCGALRSAIGKLGFLCALVVFVSDLFHIVNHLCSDAPHPRSYAGLDSANTVAHEQRNSPINLMRRSLRACGQQEYMTMLQVENILYNVMAHAKSTSPYPLHDEYNYAQFYFSHNPCCCGCGYAPPTPELPTAPAVPAAAALPVAAAMTDDVWMEGDDW